MKDVPFVVGSSDMRQRCAAVVQFDEWERLFPEDNILLAVNIRLYVHEV